MIILFDSIAVVFQTIGLKSNSCFSLVHCNRKLLVKDTPSIVMKQEKRSNTGLNGVCLDIVQNCLYKIMGSTAI